MKKTEKFYVIEQEGEVVSCECKTLADAYGMHDILIQNLPAYKAETFVIYECNVVRKEIARLGGEVMDQVEKSYALRNRETGHYCNSSDTLDFICGDYDNRVFLKDPTGIYEIVEITTTRKVIGQLGKK